MNKKSTLYIAVLVILIIAFLIINSNDKTERRVRFFEVDSTRIAAIEISTMKDTLKLVKDGDVWMIDYPVNFPPADQKIADLLEKVIKVETSNIPVSESQNSHETYKVTDSLGTTIRIYNAEGDELIHALIGKSSNYNYSHGRNNTETEVYQLYQNISSVLNPMLNSWRKKEILELAEDPAQISVGFGERFFTITSTDSLWQYQEGDSTFFINEGNKAFTTMLTNIRTFKTSSFIDDDYETYAESYLDPQMVIQVKLYSGEDIFFKFIKQDEEGKKYIIQKNDETENLYVVYDNIIRYFQKEISELKQ